ncbi:MAG: SAM-dependent methyltransferase, partial [Azonexus sp.]|nr:SAM-dependent methyltransferase [Azonexus sp.]
HPGFALVPASEVLARQGITLAGDMLRLTPHQHDTDGFFAAILERKA